MMCAVHDVAGNEHVRVRFICVPDEESEDVEHRCTEALVEEGLRADFAITGEPTDLHIGVQAKGVLAIRVEVAGTAAHGSTPWLGDNAILKAYDVFRRIETLPFSRESSDLFDRPSINVARIDGGDAFNKVPDLCSMDIDIRYLPNQDPGEILADIRALPDVRIVKTFQRAPAHVSRANPYVRALREAVSKSLEGEALSVGRDGASDAISFLEAGVPAVEFGPDRRRPSRARGVGLDRVARALPPRAGRLRRRPARVARRRRRQAAAARRRGRAGVSVLEPEEHPRARPADGEALRPRRAARSSSSRRPRSRARCCSRSTRTSRSSRASRRRSRASRTCSTRSRRAIRRRSCCSARTAASRDGKDNPPRSDTIIVVRLDPDKNATAVMSLPRDLKVTIPGHGTRQDQRGLPRRRAEAHGPHGARACSASRSTTSST